MTLSAYHATWGQFEGSGTTWADAETDSITWGELGTMTAGTMSGSSPALTWEVGDVATFAVKIRDAGGAAADATAVTCQLTLPDATTTSVTPVHTSTGVYEAGWTVTQAGRHIVQWTATGANASAYQDTFTAWDASVVPIVSLAEAKAHLNITSNEHDDELRRMCWVITRMGEATTGRVFGRRTVTDTVSGGWPEIVLSARPVIQVLTVTENGATVAASGYHADTTAGTLTRVSGYSRTSWQPGFNNITVTYSAGYVLQPPDDMQGALELLRHLWRTQRGSLRPRQDDDPLAGMGFTIPNRVAELWAADIIPGV